MHGNIAELRMFRDYNEGIGMRSPSRDAGNGAQRSASRPRITPQSIQDMLQRETGRTPSSFLGKIISRKPYKRDRELQALETFGDRILDLFIRCEITKICPNLSSRVVEEVVQKRTSNSALARYATCLGLEQLTGDSEKALADRLEMLAGFVFLHGGFKTLRTLLTCDTQRPLIPTREDLALAQYMSVARLPVDLENRVGEFGLTASAIGGVNYNNRHWIRERDCRLSAARLEKRTDSLGRSVIETVLLAFAREREPYRTPELLTKIRALIYRSRDLHPSDIQHGLTVMHDGKRVSVFHPDFISHVGNEALNSGALQCCRQHLGNDELRRSMHILMERTIPLNNLRKKVAPPHLERLTLPKKDAKSGDGRRNSNGRSRYIGTQRRNKRIGYRYETYHVPPRA